jgi:hypothetical protein
MRVEYKDPREALDFVAKYYPAANGNAGPYPHSASRQDLIVKEFLAAYYRLNREYARLLEVRQSPPSPQRDQKEHEHLQAVEQALVARDQLEDYYAAYGVIAEPTVRDGFTCDVRFGFGDPVSGLQKRTEALLIEAIVPITSVPDANLANVRVRVHVVEAHDPPAGIVRRLATAIPDSLLKSGPGAKVPTDVDKAGLAPPGGAGAARTETPEP